MRFLMILVTILIMIFVSNLNFLADDKIKMEVSMATGQVVDLEGLLTSLVVQQQAITRLLVEKGIFSTEEFSEMVRVVGKEVKPIKFPPPVEGR
jgi:hypothetical protein